MTKTLTIPASTSYARLRPVARLPRFKAYVSLHIRDQNVLKETFGSVLLEQDVVDSGKLRQTSQERYEQCAEC